MISFCQFGAGRIGAIHAASLATGIPYSTVKKHARAMGYSPPERRLSSVD
jgi:hypothetical protein